MSDFIETRLTNPSEDFMAKRHAAKRPYRTGISTVTLSTAVKGSKPRPKSRRGRKSRKASAMGYSGLSRRATHARTSIGRRRNPAIDYRKTAYTTVGIVAGAYFAGKLDDMLTNWAAQQALNPQTTGLLKIASVFGIVALGEYAASQANLPKDLPVEGFTYALATFAAKSGIDNLMPAGGGAPTTTPGYRRTTRGTIISSPTVDRELHNAGMQGTRMLPPGTHRGSLQMDLAARSPSATRMQGMPRAGYAR